MGAWIETMLCTLEETDHKVAPCMGAWIETLMLLRIPRLLCVAPCMGAWIETYLGITALSSCSGRTLYGCVD